MGRVYVGTSGFSYKEWVGPFYPRGTRPDEYLRYYASQFDAVEIPGTFYRMPRPNVLDGWRAATPDGFKFTLKAPQFITHFGRIAVPSGPLDGLLEVVPRLGDRLGAMLWQLPENMQVDAGRLAAFLERLAGALPCAFEFRHDSWFVPATYALLERHGAGLVITDGDDGREGSTPLLRTAPLVYVRLRRDAYGDVERRAWQARLRGWATDGDVFAFVKHEDAQFDPTELALELTRKLAADGVLEVPGAAPADAVAGLRGVAVGE